MEGNTNTFKKKKASGKGEQKKSIFHWMDGILKLDAVFENGLPLRYLPHILFVTGLCIFYIGNSHYVEKTTRKIDRLQIEVEDLRADYTTLKADYMFASKQSEVAKKVNRLGLKESLEPPHKIVVKEESEH